MEKITAIVLSAGRGTRMHSDIAKQYMMINQKPVLYYSLQAFSQSNVSDIIVVTGSGDEEYVKREIVEKYEFTKVSKIITGGKERYHSVYQGVLCAEESDYVLIHDGARPLITSQAINEMIQNVKIKKACVMGTPSKDTVKLVNAKGTAYHTPCREEVYNIQTPQAFSYELIRTSYDKLMKEQTIAVTDDAMVVEQMSEAPIHIIKGSYHNIKITTPEDITLAEALLHLGE